MEGTLRANVRISLPVQLVKKLRQDVKISITPGLTGMSHERYTSREQATGTRPPDELARRLFDRGGVEAVHIYSNVVTVDLAPGASSDGMLDIIRDLFLYYREPAPS